MSALATRIWKLNHPEHVLRYRWREYQLRGVAPEFFIVQAYAERFQVSRRIVKLVGTRCLTMCKSDECRRLLLGAYR